LRGWTGARCEEKMAQECVEYCAHGGICTNCSTSEENINICLHCLCIGGYEGENCLLPIKSNGNEKSQFTNIAAVIIPIIVVLLVVIVILGIILYRRRTSRQFKHTRMAETGNVEISNPIYMRDYEEDEGGEVGEAFTFDPDKPTNFTNPMYDTLFSEGANDSLSTDSEKNKLLKNKKKKSTSKSQKFFPSDELQPLERS